MSGACGRGVSFILIYTKRIISDDRQGERTRRPRPLTYVERLAHWTHSARLSRQCTQHIRTPWVAPFAWVNERREKKEKKEYKKERKRDSEQTAIKTAGKQVGGGGKKRNEIF